VKQCLTIRRQVVTTARRRRPVMTVPCRESVMPTKFWFDEGGKRDRMFII